MSDGVALSRLRSAVAALTKLDAIPERPLLPLQRARIVGQSGDRVSLQLVDRAGDLPDAGQEARQPIWYGVPGVSATHTPGQELLLAFAGADASQPVCFLATPRGQPGHVPILVRHEATTEIRLMGSAAGVVRVGPGGTQKVALGPALDTMLAALQAFAASASVAVSAAQIAAAAATLSGALAAITITKANKLEAI
jgi:hypothetical protein